MAQIAELPRLIEVDDSLEGVQEFYEQQGWFDGLPIVPPTKERVEAMCRYVDYDPQEVVSVLDPRKGEATVERIATNAVMAGCQPEYMPVIITVVQAIVDPAFNANGVQPTTHPCAALVLINGPIGRELNVNSGSGCFGPGWRANATIGRAIRLIMINIGGGTPAIGDRATHGTPAKYSHCVAENENESPWAPFHVDRGFALEDSTVALMACEAPHNVQDHMSTTGLSLLENMAGSLRATGSNNIGLHGGEPLVVFGPEHAEAIAQDGYSKEDVRNYLYEHARLPYEQWPRDWKTDEPWVAALEKDTGQRDYTPLVRKAADLSIIVAGGAGKHSCWLPTMGPMTGTVVRRIERRDGRPARSALEFGTR